MDKQYAIALGTFDGLHLGHWAVLDAAKQDGLVPAALLFSVHPAAALKRTAPPALCTNAQREDLLTAAGILPLYVDFREIMQLSPQQFFTEILQNRFAAGAVCCGENYTFGAGGVGTPAVLETLCGANGVRLHIAGTVQAAGAPVSSTRIRAALQNGDITAANRMLGRAFSYAFPVVSGDKRGRLLQFPTANQVFPAGFVQPKFGVYAGYCDYAGHRYPTVTNFGRRPTIGTDSVRSETCLLGFSGDLYGKSPEIHWLSYLRPEQKFPSLEALQAAIAADALQAREIFQNSLANRSQTL